MAAMGRFLPPMFWVAHSIRNLFIHELVPTGALYVACLQPMLAALPYENPTPGEGVGFAVFLQLYLPVLAVKGCAWRLAAAPADLSAP